MYLAQDKISDQEAQGRSRGRDTISSRGRESTYDRLNIVCRTVFQRFLAQA